MSWKSFVGQFVGSVMDDGKQAVTAPAGSSHQVRNEIDAAVAREKASRATNAS